MSQAHIEQFYSKAVKDPALVNKMLAGSSGPDDFVRNAVKEGKNSGFEFTYDEANAWIKEQQRIKASGELSDGQLEAVAGGKSSVSGVTNSAISWVDKTDTKILNPIASVNSSFLSGLGSGANTVASGLSTGGNAVANFFSSW